MSPKNQINVLKAFGEKQTSTEPTKNKKKMKIT